MSVWIRAALTPKGEDPMVVVGRVLCCIQYGVRPVPEVYIEYEGEEVSVILSDVEWDIIDMSDPAEMLPSPEPSDDEGGADEGNQGNSGRVIPTAVGYSEAVAHTEARRDGGPGDRDTGSAPKPKVGTKRKARRNTRAETAKHNLRLEAMCMDVGVILMESDLVIQVGSEIRLKSEMMQFAEISQEELKAQEEKYWAEKDVMELSSGTSRGDTDSSDSEVFDDGG